MCNRRLLNFKAGLVETAGRNVYITPHKEVKKMNLGEKIYTLRTMQNLSQGDLAEILDVSRQSISKWETNASVPELDKIMKMCDVFGISMDEMTARTDECKKPAPITTTLSHSEIVGYILLMGAVFGGILCFMNNRTLDFIILVLPFLTAGILLLRLKEEGIYFAKWTAVFGMIMYLSVVYSMKLFCPLLVIGSAGMYLYGRKYFKAHEPKKIMNLKTAVLSMAGAVSSFGGFLFYRISEDWVLNIRPEINYNTVTGATEYTYTLFEEIKMYYGQHITVFLIIAFAVVFSYLFYQITYHILAKEK